MSYWFEITEYENEMNNYFKGVSGRHIKDTLLITVKNIGAFKWSRFKGYFKCYENQSNYFFDETQIPEDVEPNGYLELVLNFPRIEKNKNSGDCYCSIQLFYENKGYNAQVIRFRKDYDLFGNDLVYEGKIEEKEEIIEEKKEEIKEEKKEEIKEEIKEEKKEEIKGEKKEEIKEIIKEEIKEEKKEEKKEIIKEEIKEEKKEKEILQPNKIEEEKVKKKEKKKEEKKENEYQIIVKKFRSAFDFAPADFSDEYILGLILKSNKDFQKAMMLHLALEDKKIEEKKRKSKSEEGLEQLVSQFRQAYQLSEQDYPSKKLKEILAKKEGNFENAFEELMSFIQ